MKGALSARWQGNSRVSLPQDYAKETRERKGPKDACQKKEGEPKERKEVQSRCLERERHRNAQLQLGTLEKSAQIIKLRGPVVRKNTVASMARRRPIASSERQGNRHSRKEKRSTERTFT